MRTITEFLKNELNKYKNSIQIIAGFITVLIGISSLGVRAFESKYNIAIICIGFFFIVKRIADEIVTAKKESFAVIVAKYSKRQIFFAKFIRLINYLFWIFPVYLSTSFVIAKYNKYNTHKQNIGLIITSFSNSGDDDFSYKLFNSLDAELQNSDTINAIRVNKFINAGSLGYIDSLKEIFNHNSYTRGFLVYGKRSVASKLFDCNIYLSNVINQEQPLPNVHSKNIIYLQNPDVINFSIDYQSQIISEFILGLLYYNAHNFSVSKEKFQRSSGLNANEENKKFMAYCRLFIGHSLYKNKQFVEAAMEYKSGVDYDPMNAYLHFNLANTLLVNADSINAYKEYAIANKLNSKLENPIKEFHSVKKRVLNSRDPDNINEHTSNNKLKGTGNIPVNKKAISTKNGFSVVIAENNKHGVINSKGDTIVRCQYDYVDQYVYTYNGKRFFIVKNAAAYGAVNEQGRLEIPINYPTVQRVYGVIRTLEDAADASKISGF